MFLFLVKFSIYSENKVILVCLYLLSSPIMPPKRQIEHKLDDDIEQFSSPNEEKEDGEILEEAQREDLGDELAPAPPPPAAPSFKKPKVLQDPNMFLVKNKLFYANIKLEDIEFVASRFNGKVYLRAKDMRFGGQGRDLLVIHPYTALRFPYVYPWGNLNKGKFGAKTLDKANATYTIYQDPWNPALGTNADGADPAMANFFSWLDALYDKLVCFILDNDNGIAETHINAARAAALKEAARHIMREGPVLGRLAQGRVELTEDERKLYSQYELLQKELGATPLEEVLAKDQFENPNWLRCLRPPDYNQVLKELRKEVQTFVNRTPGKPTRDKNGVTRLPKRPMVVVKGQLFRPMFSALKHAQPPPLGAAFANNKNIKKMWDNDFAFQEVVMKNRLHQDVKLEQRRLNDGDVCAGCLSFRFDLTRTQEPHIRGQLEPKVIYFYQSSQSGPNQPSNKDLIEENPVICPYDEEENEDTVADHKITGLDYEITEEEAKRLLDEEFDVSMLIAPKDKNPPPPPPSSSSSSSSSSSPSSIVAASFSSSSPAVVPPAT